MSYYAKLSELGALAYWSLSADGTDHLNGRDVTVSGASLAADQTFSDLTNSYDFNTDGSDYATSASTAFDDLLDDAGTNYITLGAWVKQDTGVNAKFHRIISKGDQTNIGWCWGVKMSGTTAYPQFNGWGTTTNFICACNTTSITNAWTAGDGNWHFVATCIHMNAASGTAGDDYFFVDGQIGWINTTSNYTGAARGTDGGLDLTIADRADIPSGGFNFDGHITGAFIIAGKVQRNDIMDLYQRGLNELADTAGAITPSLLVENVAANDSCHYIWSPNTVQYWADYSNNDYWEMELTASQSGVTAGDANDPATTASWGGCPYAANFNGSQANISIDNTHLPDVYGGSGAANASFEVVGYLDSLPGSGKWFAAVSNADFGTADAECFFGIDENGKPLLGVSHTTGAYEIQGDVAISTGEWFHIVMWSDGAVSDYGCYVNGSNAGATLTVSTGTGTPDNYTGPWRIGFGLEGGTATGYRWTGELAFVGVYDEKLSAARIGTHYDILTNGGLTGYTAPGGGGGGGGGGKITRGRRRGGNGGGANGNRGGGGRSAGRRVSLWDRRRRRLT